MFRFWPLTMTMTRHRTVRGDYAEFQKSKTSCPAFTQPSRYPSSLSCIQFKKRQSVLRQTSGKEVAFPFSVFIHVS